MFFHLSRVVCGQTSLGLRFMLRLHSVASFARAAETTYLADARKVSFLPFALGAKCEQSQWRALQPIALSAPAANVMGRQPIATGKEQRDHQIYMYLIN